MEVLLKAGYTWVVDADLKSYFDSIPHAGLMDELRRFIADGRVLDLLEGFLKQDILEDLALWTPEQRTPQGAVATSTNAKDNTGADEAIDDLGGGSFLSAIGMPCLSPDCLAQLPHALSRPNARPFVVL
ncbi:MAG: hypothetical protein MZV70_68830 [Desulfobacterales bacterium]|nr:hypothetical protein [Desulfobacterales bacterium]